MTGLLPLTQPQKIESNADPIHLSKTMKMPPNKPHLIDTPDKTIIQATKPPDEMSISDLEYVETLTRKLTKDIL